MSNILITGANRGVGLALARRYLAAGDRIFASCRRSSSASALQSLAAESTGQVTIHAIDVSDVATIEATARELTGVQIDVLVNNVGVLGGPHAEQSFACMNFDNWRHTFEVMTLGPFRMVQSFMDHLKIANGATVATITSQVGSSAWTNGGLYAYASCKAASNRVVQILAMDLSAHNIRVIAVHPGYVNTDMTAHRADISPEDSAAGMGAFNRGRHKEAVLF